MLRSLLFLTVLLALPAFAQPLLPRADTTPNAPEMTPQQRLTQFRHDEINLLALRADAPSLLAAALMAQPDANDKSRPTALKPAALLKRAQAAGTDVPLVWWVSAIIQCRATAAAKPCPAEATLEELDKHDAGNAAVWVLSMLRAQRTKNPTLARAALTSAAQAAGYDDYFGKIIGMLNDAGGILPVSEDLIRASGEVQTGPEGFRLVAAAGIAAATMPPLQTALTTACKDAAKHADIVADCMAVADKMTTSGTMASQVFGFKLLLGLLPPGAQRDTAQAHARGLAWRTQSIGQLAARLQDDVRVTRIYTGILAKTGSESAAVDGVLRSQAVRLEPPADWQPVASGTTPGS